MIDAIQGITSVAQALELGPTKPSSSGDFAQAVGGGLKTLNADLNASDEVLRSLAAGKDIPLHDVMIVMAKAQVDLQFAVELRNRLVASYQQLSQMQV